MINTITNENQPDESDSLSGSDEDETDAPTVKVTQKATAAPTTVKVTQKETPAPTTVKVTEKETQAPTTVKVTQKEVPQTKATGK